jgi:hypothetical protein
MSIRIHYLLQQYKLGLHHKVFTYIKYRAVSGVFRTIDTPPPLHPASDIVLCRECHEHQKKRSFIGMVDIDVLHYLVSKISIFIIPLEFLKAPKLFNVKKKKKKNQNVEST